jgi:hypothetical protein
VPPQIVGRHVGPKVRSLTDSSQFFGELGLVLSMLLGIVRRRPRCFLEHCSANALKDGSHFGG